MSKIIIVAESGADLPEDIIKRYGLYILPLHVAMDGKNLKDGQFPVTDIIDYYKRTKKVPTTSATNPDEYLSAFKEIHQKYPDAQILHLCYSAVTTATYQNALIASEGMEFVHHIDTKNVSGGQAMIVIEAAQYLEHHPDATIAEISEKVSGWIARTRLAFIPGSLEYLKAGGRVSNAVYLGATLLNLKPMIELKDGYLVATKKYRGSMKKVCRKVILDICEKYKLEKTKIYLLHAEGLAKAVREEAENILKEKGYHNFRWINTGGVITTHGGPGAFGIIGMDGKNSN